MDFPWHLSGMLCSLHIILGGISSGCVKRGDGGNVNVRLLILYILNRKFSTPGRKILTLGYNLHLWITFLNFCGKILKSQIHLSVWHGNIYFFKYSQFCCKNFVVSQYSWLKSAFTFKLMDFVFSSISHNFVLSLPINYL